jgi:hypothetical protein
MIMTPISSPRGHPASAAGLRKRWQANSKQRREREGEQPHYIPITSLLLLNDLAVYPTERNIASKIVGHGFPALQ